MAKAKTKKKRGKAYRPLKQKVGICWYEASQYPRLLELVADPESLEPTYEQWLAEVNDAIEQSKGESFFIIKIKVDVEQMASWCENQGRPLDGTARSQYASQLLQSGRYEQA